MYDYDRGYDYGYDRGYGYDADDIEFEERLQVLERKQQKLQELAEPRGIHNPFDRQRQTQSAPYLPPNYPVSARQTVPQPTFAPEPQTHIDVTSILCGTVIALIVFFFLKALWSRNEPESGPEER